MGLLKKYQLSFIIAGVIIVVYLLTRILTLTFLPIFTDEAIYVRWAQIAKNDASWRFISLTDGKQPLYIWIVMVVMQFIEDPLVSGRLVSVGAGLLSMIGLFLLGREIFRNYKIGLLTSFLYLIYPFALVYDRMALYDSLVGATAVWGLYLTVLMVRSLKVEHAFLLGFATGAAVLNKSSGFFILYLLPFSLLLLKSTKKLFSFTIFRFVGLSAIVVVITYAMYFILRLSPFFYIIDEKNAVFVYPFQEWIKHPVEFFISNLRGLLDWFVRYFGPSFILLSILGIFFKGFFKEKVLLLIWFLAPFLALALFGKTIYPRYILFMTLSLLPLVAYAFFTLWQRYKLLYYRVLLCFLVFSYPLLLSFQIFTDFGRSFIPSSDKGQYLNSWPSGVGVKESLLFFSSISRNEKISIYTAGTFGLLPFAYEIYQSDLKNATIEGFWPVTQEIPLQIVEKAKKERAFVVFYQDCPPCLKTGIAPNSWPLQQVFQKKRVDKDSYFTVYEVNPE